MNHGTFDWITGGIAKLGYRGVAILTFLENIFPSIPSDVVIPLAGFAAAQGSGRRAAVNLEELLEALQFRSRGPTGALSLI